MVAVPFALQWLALGATPLYSRIVEPLRAGSDWNLTTRSAMNQAVAQSVQAAPVIGKGAGSTNQLTVKLPGSAVRHRVWTGNMELFVLHDSGALGLLALLGVVAAALWVALRAARRAGPGWRDLGVPMTVSALALLWAWQFTHALWLMYAYVFLGLFVAVTEPPAAPAVAADPRAAPRAHPARGEASSRTRP
jgi:O-antigen ligase